jgi:hypothetical protein
MWLDTPQYLLDVMLAQIPSLAAERQLAAMEGAAFPHMDERGRQQLLNEKARSMGRDDRKDAAPATQADLAHLGIQVERVKPEG